MGATPGAGEYTDQSITIGSKKPSYRIPSRMETSIGREARLREDLPGPGRYEPLKQSKSHHGITVPASRRGTSESKNLSATDT